MTTPGFAAVIVAGADVVTRVRMTDETHISLRATAETRGSTKRIGTNDASSIPQPAVPIQY